MKLSTYFKELCVFPTLISYIFLYKNTVFVYTVMYKYSVQNSLEKDLLIKIV